MQDGQGLVVGGDRPEALTVGGVRRGAVPPHRGGGPVPGKNFVGKPVGEAIQVGEVDVVQGVGVALGPEGGGGHGGTLSGTAWVVNPVRGRGHGFRTRGWPGCTRRTTGYPGTGAGGTIPLQGRGWWPGVRDVAPGPIGRGPDRSEEQDLLPDAENVSGHTSGGPFRARRRAVSPVPTWLTRAGNPRRRGGPVAGLLPLGPQVRRHPSSGQSS